jgi:hypothetical protein
MDIWIDDFHAMEKEFIAFTRRSAAAESPNTVVTTQDWSSREQRQIDVTSRKERACEWIRSRREDAYPGPGNSLIVTESSGKTKVTSSRKG